MKIFWLNYIEMLSNISIARYCTALVQFYCSNICIYRETLPGTNQPVSGVTGVGSYEQIILVIVDKIHSTEIACTLLSLSIPEG